MNERPLIDVAQEKILSLADETKFAANGIVSRTLLRTANTRVVLFGFAEGQELTEHTSTQSAVIQILSGECEFSLGWQTASGQGWRPDLHAAKSAARRKRDEAIFHAADAFKDGNRFRQTMSENIVTLDVREDLRNGREPFSKIMGAVAQLQPDEKLLLVAPFEPTPLFSVLGNQGFDHESKQIQSGDWEVLFTRRSGETRRVRSAGTPALRRGENRTNGNHGRGCARPRTAAADGENS